MAGKNIFSGLGRHYDKLMAFVLVAAFLASLVYLLLHIGRVPGLEREFKHKMDGLTPTHEHAAAADTNAMVKAEQAIDNPFQIPVWTNSLTVPELRVWCQGCRHPIRWSALVCPFCKEPQPEITDFKRDDDGDGMPNEWEKKHGFDSNDRADAELDPDKDTFTNVEEYEEGTDPNDGQSYPALHQFLSIKGIRPIPFPLRFTSISKMPDGSYTFGVKNLPLNRTVFAVIGDKVGGFELVGFEDKVVEKPGGLGDKDVSELTVKRGAKVYVMVLRQDVVEKEYRALLHYARSDEDIPVRVGSEFRLSGDAYRVLRIDIEDVSVVIRRARDGKVETIKKKYSN